MNSNQYISSVQLVETSYGRIAYREQGSGPVSIFLHAFALSSYQWRDVIPSLAKDFRCIAIDLMGMGNSLIKKGVGLTLTDQAKMVSEAIDNLNLGDVHLVGNDSGGGVAQILAILRKEKLLSLCLIDSEVHDNFPPEGLQPIIEAAKRNELGEMFNALANDLDLARQAMGAAIYSTPETSFTEEALAAYLQPILSNLASIQTFTGFVCAMHSSHLTVIKEDLKQLDIPALILWGDADQVFPIQWGEWLCDTLPNAHLEVIRNGALCWPEEQPTVLVDHLHKFWSEQN